MKRIFCFLILAAFTLTGLCAQSSELQSINAGGPVGLKSADTIQNPVQAEQNGFGLQPEIFNYVKTTRRNVVNNFENINDYMVTPGDTFVLRVSVGNVTTINPTGFIDYPIHVKRDYTMELPIVGIYDCTGKKLQDIQREVIFKIRSNITVVYANLFMQSPAEFNIFVYGGVNVPGYVICTPMTSLVDAIATSGGFKAEASYRQIQIVRDDKTLIYDISKFYNQADIASNPLLRPGDKIFVPHADIVVVAAGKIKYPGRYELLKTETLKDLINIAGGLAKDAYKNKIDMERFDENGNRNQIEVTEEAFETTTLMMQDTLYIRSISENSAVVTIDGAVYGKPLNGRTNEIAPNTSLRIEIPYSTGMTLINALDRVGGITPYAITEKAFIRSRNSLDQIRIESLEQLISSRSQEFDVTLKPGDTIVIPMQLLQIFVGGEVKRPGAIPYNNSLTAFEYIMLSGGFTDNAEINKLYTIDSTNKKVIVKPDSRMKPGSVIYIEKNGAMLAAKAFDQFYVFNNFLNNIIGTVNNSLSFGLRLDSMRRRLDDDPNNDSNVGF